MSAIDPKYGKTQPPEEAADARLPRDPALARVKDLLSEDFVLLDNEGEDETEFPRERESLSPEPVVRLVDLDDVVEVERPAPTERRLPKWAEESLSASAVANKQKSLPGSAGLSPSIPPMETQSPKPNKIIHSFFQAFIVVFVLTWVFILGILIGRGHLWEAGPGHALVVWLEEKAGWQPSVQPEVILKDNGVTRFPYEPPPSGQQSRSSASSNPFDDLVVTEEYVLEDGRVTTARRPTSMPSGGPVNSPASTAVVPPSNGRSSIAAPRLPESPLYSNRNNASSPSPAASGQQQPAGTSAQTGSQPANGNNAAVEEQDGKFAVQVTLAFNEEEAEKRLARLKEQGFPAYYYQNASGRFPVRVGRFENYEDAEKAKTRLEELGYTRPYISRLQPD